MRNLFYLLIVVTMIFSCGKEEISQDVLENKAEIVTIQKNTELSSLMRGLEIEKGMVSFKDNDHFWTVVNGLDKLTDEHDIAFVNSHPGLSIDELEEVEERIGYSEVQPLIDFEKMLNFESRRSVVAVQEEEWLNNGELDFENNPRAIDMHTDGIRSVLTPEGFALIGGEVVDLNTKNDDEKSSCWKSNDEYEEAVFDNGKRKWEMTLAAGNILGTAKATCEVCHYKKKRGQFRKRRAFIDVDVFAKYRTLECDENGSFGDDRQRTRRCLKVGASHGAFNTPRYKDYDVQGHMTIDDDAAHNFMYIITE